MANNTENSFSELIENFTILQNNAFLVLQKISESVTSEADELEFTLMDVNKETSTYKLPSYKSIKKDIERIDETLKTMLGLNENGKGIVRNADGSYSVLYKSELTAEPTRIESVEIPKYFNTKSNWFFENFLNPLLYISFDVSKYVPQDESKVCVRRLILKKDERQAVKEAFDRLFLGRNDITYASFLKWCADNGISYTLDEDIQDLPLSTLKYFGSFIVRKADDFVLTNTSGVVGTERRYYLDKITYSDSTLDINDNLELKVGQKLSVGQSVYEITMVDSSIRAITLDRISGYDGIIENTELKLYSEPTTPKTIHVNISIDEREVIFFKSINDESNVISREWSNGIAIYTNNLSIQTEVGSISLPSYYDSFVYDFGQQLIGQTKDDKISAFYALKPNAPEPIASNFKVVQINSHLGLSDAVAEINKYKAEMTAAESMIKTDSDKIKELRDKINSTQYADEDARNIDVNDLNKTIKNKSYQIESYNKNANALNTLLTSNPLAIKDPKFRVRGFFNMPKKQFSEDTGSQEIVQFEVAYRYASKENATINPEEMTFHEENGLTSTATFTVWNYYKTPIREKVFNSDEGIFEWSSIDLNDKDANKPNQIDIPINPGESVIFKVRSISEAGFPENPQCSDWSKEISITFPEELNVIASANDIYEESNLSQAKIAIRQYLVDDGYEDHINDSGVDGDKMWKHNARNINSGFYDINSIIISLYDKLVQQDALIQELKNKLENAKAKLSVKLIDTSTKEVYSIKSGDVIKTTPSCYGDEATTDGEIIKKVYNVEISNNNTSGSTLELISQFPGTKSDTFDDLYKDRANNLRWAKIDYEKPSLCLFVNPDETPIDKDDINHYMFGNKQLLGQFVYFRYCALDGTPLYEESENYNPENCGGWENNVTVSTVTNKNKKAVNNVGPDKRDDIWSGDFNDNVPLGGGIRTNFCIPRTHPALTSKQNIWHKLADASKEDLAKCLLDPMKVIENHPELTDYAGKKIYPAFIQSKHLNPQKVGYYKNSGKWFCPQAAIKNDKGDEIKYDFYPAPKCAFSPDDKYLIGLATLGSYFYPDIDNYDIIRIIDDNSLKKNLEYGEENKIVIPLVFEYRLSDSLGKYGDYVLNGPSPSADRILGLDITTANETISFDVEATAYKFSIPKEKKEK